MKYEKYMGTKLIHTKNLNVNISDKNDLQITEKLLTEGQFFHFNIRNKQQLSKGNTSRSRCGSPKENNKINQK